MIPLFVPAAPVLLPSAHRAPVCFSATVPAQRNCRVSRNRPAHVLGTTTTLRMSMTEPPKDPTPKELAQLYGGSYLTTSVGISIISYAAFYALITAGVDVRALLNAFGDWISTTPLGRPSVLDNVSDTAGAAALAYIAHKATSPLRFPVTIAATPLVAKVFSRKKDSDKSS